MARHRETSSKIPATVEVASSAPEGEAQRLAETTPAETALPESSEPLPNGLKELDSKELALCDGWEKCVMEDGSVQWINRRDYKTRDGSVPQGVVRSTDEAHALEEQRCG